MIVVLFSMRLLNLKIKPCKYFSLPPVVVRDKYSLFNTTHTSRSSRSLNLWVKMTLSCACELSLWLSHGSSRIDGKTSPRRDAWQIDTRNKIPPSDNKLEVWQLIRYKSVVLSRLHPIQETATRLLLRYEEEYNPPPPSGKVRRMTWRPR